MGALYLGFVANVLNLGWMYDNYVPLLTGSLIISVGLSFYLYISSFKRGALLAPGTSPHSHLHRALAHAANFSLPQASRVKPVTSLVSGSLGASSLEQWFPTHEFPVCPRTSDAQRLPINPGGAVSPHQAHESSQQHSHATRDATRRARRPESWADATSAWG